MPIYSEVSIVKSFMIWRTGGWKREPGELPLHAANKARAINYLHVVGMDFPGFSGAAEASAGDALRGGRRGLPGPPYTCTRTRCNSSHHCGNSWPGLGPSDLENKFLPESQPFESHRTQNLRTGAPWGSVDCLPGTRAGTLPKPAALTG